MFSHLAVSHSVQRGVCNPNMPSWAMRCRSVGVVCVGEMGWWTFGVAFCYGFLVWPSGSAFCYWLFRCGLLLWPSGVTFWSGLLVYPVPTPTVLHTQMVTEVGSTHPTGIHSYYNCRLRYKRSRFPCPVTEKFQLVQHLPRYRTCFSWHKILNLALTGGSYFNWVWSLNRKLYTSMAVYVCLRVLKYLTKIGSKLWHIKLYLAYCVCF